MVAESREFRRSARGTHKGTRRGNAEVNGRGVQRGGDEVGTVERRKARALGARYFSDSFLPSPSLFP